MNRPLPGWPRGLREELAAEYVGLSVTSLHALRTRGEFPQPVALTKGRIVFLRDDLDAWLDAKAGKVLANEEWPEA